MLSEPTQWVPYLAIILDRKRPSQNADQITQTMIMGLIDLGLIRVVRNPQQPDQSQLDTRILEMLPRQLHRRCAKQVRREEGSRRRAIRHDEECEIVTADLFD